jgi:hypothetical protein
MPVESYKRAPQALGLRQLQVFADQARGYSRSEVEVPGAKGEINQSTRVPSRSTARWQCEAENRYSRSITSNRVSVPG